MKPFVKWAGGKRQILSRIKNYLPTEDDSEKNIDYTYIEPFLGGGAVFFDLQLKPKKAIINDLNEDLINAYRVIKSEKYKELIEKLDDYKKRYTNEDKDELYYEVRMMDREDDWPDEYSDVDKAARMIFLNKTCYNGLYRVNSKGQFNTPVGRYNNPLICDSKNIEEVHNYLNSFKIEIMSESYEKAIEKADCNTYIYVDPPYDYEDDDGFTKYQMNGFTFEEFKKLKHCCDKAIDKGATIVISNNATEKVKKLFEEDNNYSIYYDKNEFSTLRSINSDGANRRIGKEIIIVGVSYDIPQANNVNSIIELLKLTQEELEDKEIVKQKIGVKTDRQVSYYLSALYYLNYIDRNGKFTEDAIVLNKNDELIKTSLFNSLFNDSRIFGPLHKQLRGKDINKEPIIKHLKERYNKYSDSTIERRYSTVKQWLQWMRDYEERNN